MNQNLNTILKKTLELDMTERGLDELGELLNALSEADISTILASLENGDYRVGTATDSAIFSLMTELVKMEAVDEVPLGVDLPPSVSVTSFKIRETAKKKIADLFADHRNDRDNP